MTQKLSGKRRATLEAIFANPIPADIAWRDIEVLITALGGEKSERKGSRVAFCLNGVRAVFHRPHPRPQTNKKLVQSVRGFLINAEIRP